jgi:cell fate regulator YaaT (PSP1 superfamily)
MDVNNVLGIRFQEAGKIYYFEPGGYEDDLTIGSSVVVETSRGVELGRVVIAPGQVLTVDLTEPLKPINRPATADDLDRAADLRDQARSVTELARERARALGLPMKVVSAQYTLDGQRLTIYFTSEGRVDFRELARDVSLKIHAQVQLRQVGPRDQAKVIGGYGRCGRRLCCTSWLTAFPAISIKMAKEQNLPLNPAKISGQCGRLLCCLSYENDIYKKLKAELPRPDAMLSTPAGAARVVAVNAVKQMVTLEMVDGRQVVQVTVEQLGYARGVSRPLAEGELVGEADADAFIEHEEISFTSVSLVRDVRPPAHRPPQGRPGDAGPGRGAADNRGRAEDARGPAGPSEPRPQQPPMAQQAATEPPAAGEESGEAARRKRRRRRHRGGGAAE